MIAPTHQRNTTFRRYNLFLEISALLLITAFLFLTIWLAMAEMADKYLELRLADANQVDLLIGNQLNDAREDFERFIDLPEPDRSPEVLRLLGAFSDIYRLDERLRVARIYKATPASRVFAGFSFAGGTIGGSLKTLDSRGTFSEMTRAYEDDAPSVYLAMPAADGPYLGRLNLDYVQNFLSEFSDITGIPVMLVASDGFVMLSGDANLKVPSIDLKHWARAPSARRGLHAGGRDWIPLISKRFTLGAKVVMLIPTHPLQTQRRILLLAALGFLAGMIVLVYFKNRQLDRLILQPIAAFAKRMRALEQGQPLAGESDSGRRFAELDSIHTGFRNMAEAIVQRERSLRESEEKFRLAFDNANAGMCLVDLQGRVLQVNDKMTAIFGYRRQELEGMSVNDLAVPDDRDLSPRYIDDAVQGTGDTATFVKRYRHRQGQMIYCQVSPSLVRDAQGQPRYFISQVQDISERRRYEDDLQQARDAAEIANRAKSTFLAHMSHEIRTPLNAIIGMTYLMGQSRLDEAQRRDLHTIEVAGRNLLALINDILDVSKIEAGELDLERRVFLLPEVLIDLRVMFSAIAAAKGLALDVAELPDGLPTRLVGDSHRLRQVLINLLNNAIKFTPTGGVTLRIDEAQSPPTDQDIRLHLRVTDTGVGMSTAVQAKLFQPFVQADSATGREFGGTGLGLSIVKHLAELMGGSVGVISRPGAGSTFWLELPFEVASAAPSAAPPADATHAMRLPTSADDPTDRQLPMRLGGVFGGLAGVRVLVVDDSAMNLEVIQRLLASEGACATLCTGGDEALAVLRDRPDGYDIVLMDLQMPGLDGCETTIQIRQQLKLASLPIIAVTAGATTTEQQRAAAAGMDDFLSKPVDPTRLVQAVRRHIETARGQPLPLAPTQSPARGAPAQTHNDWPEIAGIDTTEAATNLAGDVAFFRDLLGPFVADNTQVMLDIRRLLDTGDRGTAAKRVHKLRGQAGHLGATRLRDAAGALEDALDGAVADLDTRLLACETACTQLFDAVGFWLDDEPSGPMTQKSGWTS